VRAYRWRVKNAADRSGMLEKRPGQMIAALQGVPEGARRAANENAGVDMLNGGGVFPRIGAGQNARKSVSACAWRECAEILLRVRSQLYRQRACASSNV